MSLLDSTLNLSIYDMRIFDSKTIRLEDNPMVLNRTTNADKLL